MIGCGARIPEYGELSLIARRSPSPKVAALVRACWGKLRQVGDQLCQAVMICVGPLKRNRRRPVPRGQHPSRPGVLALLYAWTASSDVPEMRPIAGTIRRWEDEVLAGRTTAGNSNGPTERACSRPEPRVTGTGWTGGCLPRERG